MQGLDPTIKAKVDSWLSGNYDEATKTELRKLIEQNAVTELTDSFYKDLEFGTGGLRGIMGVGSNRMNKYTLGAATQGFANYLKSIYPGEQIKVAIAHDCRNNASLFANVTANVFTANGIEVHLFNELRPTPQLSFACRELNCYGGVMLTASHNPKEYNGYKAYGRDGGQLIAPHDKNVVNEVAKIKSIDEIKFEGNPALLHGIGKEMDDAYLNAIVKESLSKDAITRQKDLKIVFSPIHGTGFTLVPPALKAYGFENVILVEEQCTMDGNFPTVIYPNPEEQEALTLALKKAKETDADLVMATDPDADRVGIAIKDDKGEFILLNGNQTGSLLMDYVLRAWDSAGRLNKDTYVVKTIVTSYLMDEIAASYNVDCYNVLTGFKFIGDIMTKNEGKRRFVVGGEESYGYLVGEHARDKDAVIACTMIAEMTAYYKDQGSSLFEALQSLYLSHGYYKEKLISLTKKGKAGAEEIKEMMENYRVNTPKSLGGSKVSVLKDYGQQKETNLATGEVSVIDLPKSDVLQFFTEDGSVISARPSGTEPKIKFYCSVKGELASKADYYSESENLDAKIDAVMKDLGVA
ncbi:MAG: phospho-sugar mutase [Bacteroidetes bacterium]|nr:phospho-sugar mutase [Bacteroidota bacterium]